MRSDSALLSIIYWLFIERSYALTYATSTMRSFALIKRSISEYLLTATFENFESILSGYMARHALRAQIWVSNPKVKRAW